MNAADDFPQLWYGQRTARGSPREKLGSVVKMDALKNAWVDRVLGGL